MKSPALLSSLKTQKNNRPGNPEKPIKDIYYFAEKVRALFETIPAQKTGSDFVGDRVKTKLNSITSFLTFNNF